MTRATRTGHAAAAGLLGATFSMATMAAPLDCAALAGKSIGGASIVATAVVAAAPPLP